MRWLIAFAFIMSAPTAMAAPKTVHDYMTQPQAKADARIAYGAEPAQVVELFVPKGLGPHPVVILIHGGCYLAEYEGLRQTSGIAADLARRGYAVWNVEYRKLGDAGAGYPGTFLDVAEACAPKRRTMGSTLAAWWRSVTLRGDTWRSGRRRGPGCRRIASSGAPNR
jgi:acetyl esterase/lipase